MYVKESHVPDHLCLGEDMVPLWLLVIFAACVVASMLLCGIAMKLFPKFRSGEYKPGPHRSDLPAGGREIKTIELPLVGGPAFTLALLATGITAGYLLDFNVDQWKLLLIGLGTTAGYMIIGFVDDWHKVYSKEGIRERSKFISVMAISMGAAFLYFWLVPSGRQPSTLYAQLPIIGSLVNLIIVNHIDYAWLLFLMLMTGVIGTMTSLSVDFSDGLDGLAGGLVFSAALAFGIIVTGIINGPHSEGLVVELLSLLCAGSVLGFLPWNWPSSWAARRGSAKRRAKIYMGDSGALALGGLLAMVAIFARQEILLLMVGAAFVLEGLSALISARILTPFFRKRLQMLRFANMRDTYIPHTEFPRPFLATPLHHHFDLLGWDRRRLVYGAWALGACFGILGVMIGIAPFTWQRYLARIAVLIVAWIIWSSGSWTRRYFIGKHPAERTRRRRLALFYGFPYSIMGIKLCHLVEIIEASEDVIETPAEEAVLWQRITIYDARGLLGLFCYRAGYYPAALAQWTRIPEGNRALRPEIARLLAEVDNRLALEQQETQPMRRDQILRQQPIISGNLPPADLPNPYEPVRNEEKDGWMMAKPNDFSDDDDDEEQQMTAPLRSDGAVNHLTNGHITNGAAFTAGAPVARKNWFARLIHPSPDRGS
jgi:UDP-N-acetylmuramyl pentapeptide phosphotransferase/UDP-N-acetylglucosamine-1-phosphate transferase